jgi:hypothetical protein
VHYFHQFQFDIHLFRTCIQNDFHFVDTGIQNDIHFVDTYNDIG